ncbi:GTPase Era [Sandarakinorhabdus cyanobacteriorum]|uniref:GTPase Era n=1 Tax=Sandarakinorhabdus cyanobacteriorum TaxID=1981098 RepID=A0A255Y5T6_9SPHN|nr:GTPase Era [Sandarakinorhabdus cyanobacteriorum]OYQ24054.1 GTPase Era [Sandarakinorhabdus cyanobacteriorum]
MMDETTIEITRCGAVAVVGAPNAGKSTLVNALVGQKVAIVSAKVQTTRQRLVGIAVAGQAQLLLVDTPGIFRPRRRLDRAMVKAAWDGTDDADLIALVIDAKAGLKGEVPAIVEALANRRERKYLILNKVDICVKEKLLVLAQELNARVAFEETFFVSASTGDGVAGLKAALAAAMPAGPWHYPEDQLSDATTRLMASELTREQLYLQLHAELPYSATIETEKWEERRDGSTAIHQQIIVERDSQKAIVLGKGGLRIREIGAAARAAISELTGRPVHLFLHVKVKPDWGDDRSLYSAVGLDFVD